MRRAFAIRQWAGLLGICGFGVLTISSALAASGHGGHGGSGGHGGRGGGGGSRGFASSRGQAGTRAATTARVGATASVQKSGIQVSPILPTGCPPGSGVNGCRRCCPGHGGYFFGHYGYFDEYWFRQYYYLACLSNGDHQTVKPFKMKGNLTN